nr:nitroreductase family protein [Acidithiobacillus ferrooxidans]
MDIGEMFLRNIGRPNVKSNITTSYDIGAFNQQYNDSIVTHLPVSGEILDVNLLQCLNSRSSCINFDENDNLNDDDLGYILKNAFGLAPRDGIEKRAYPSGGGFYPVEAYIVKSSVTVQATHLPKFSDLTDPDLHSARRDGDEERRESSLLAAAGRGISGERTVGQELLCAGGDRRSHAALLAQALCRFCTNAVAVRRARRVFAGNSGCAGQDACFTGRNSPVIRS